MKKWLKNKRSTSSYFKEISLSTKHDWEMSTVLHFSSYFQKQVTITTVTSEFWATLHWPSSRSISLPFYMKILSFFFFRIDQFTGCLQRSAMYSIAHLAVFAITSEKCNTEWNQYRRHLLLSWDCTFISILLVIPGDRWSDL